MMILEWMAYASLCAALIALAASCVDGVLGALHRARRGLWIAAIASSTIVPFALPFHLHSTPAARPAFIDAAPIVGSVVKTPTSNRLDVIVLSLWVAASASFALVLLVAHRRTLAALEHCRRETVAGSPAFVSNDFGPAVVGVLRHHIVVPSWTLGLPEDEQRLVVAHELEHARSGDPLLALGGACAVLAMPWNPALWWQLSRLRLAIELDCDARVSKKSGDAIAYSRLLVSVGERALATRQPVLAMSRSRSALAKRFEALLSTDAVEPRRAAAVSLLAAGTIASVAFVPSPNMSNVVDALRVRRPPAQQIVPAPTAQATFTPSASDKPLAGVVQRRAVRSASARPRNRLTAVGDLNSLPPVSVVPSAQRGPLDSVVVATAKLPAVVRRGGFIMASPGGGGGARSGAATNATPIGATSSDSNRAIRAGRGGRAVLVARPDTARPPR